MTDHREQKEWADAAELAKQLREAALSGDMPMGRSFDCLKVAKCLDSLAGEVERLRGTLTDSTLHLEALCDSNYEHRYEGIDMPCGGCYDAVAAARAALSPHPSERKGP